MKRGWWKLEIDVRINGIKVDFEDEVPADAKRKVMKTIASGCVAGEIEVPDSWAPMECKEDCDESIPLF